MIVQILKEEINSKVRRDDEIKLAMAKANGIKVSSVDRWLRDDNVMLTTATNLLLIKNHFQFDDSVTLTEEKELQATK